MRTRRLTEDEFKATMTPKMHNVQESATDVLDIWPYVHSVPSSDLEGHVVYEPFVDDVYRTEDGHFDHVMVMTRTKDVYLVVVVDLASDSFHGQWLLDLNREYGMILSRGCGCDMLQITKSDQYNLWFLEVIPAIRGVQEVSILLDASATGQVAST